MHELGIAASILESVQTEALLHPGGRITKVGVKIGELSGVDCDALQFGFEVLVKDTEWEPVVLDVGIYSPRAALLQVRQRISHDGIRSRSARNAANSLPIASAEKNSTSLIWKWMNEPHRSRKEGPERKPDSGRSSCANAIGNLEFCAST